MKFAIFYAIESIFEVIAVSWILTREDTYKEPIFIQTGISLE